MYRIFRLSIPRPNALVAIANHISKSRSVVPDQRNQVLSLFEIDRDAFEQMYNERTTNLLANGRYTGARLQQGTALARKL